MEEAWIRTAWLDFPSSPASITGPSPASELDPCVRALFEKSTACLAMRKQNPPTILHTIMSCS